MTERSLGVRPGPKHAALLVTAFLVSAIAASARAPESTYAERLGWPAGQRVVIFHVDDVGMSHESNVGAIRSLEDGVATSFSVMMPCSWVPEIVEYLGEHPGADAGLHLTLTSEWDQYRWGPVVGGVSAPGLIDADGYLWSSVPEVVAHATPDEVEREIRAQVAKARAMGFEPTHLDSHMGTLFATPELLERYVRVGIDTGIPIMIPGGHNAALSAQYRQDAIRRLEARGEWHGQEIPEPPNIQMGRDVGRRVWDAGLPVLDDLHNTSYGWRPADPSASDEELRRLKVERYSAALRRLEPGVTMIILHATDAGPAFRFISSSGPTRRGDLLAMTAPELRRVVEQEGIVLTTWRELKQRRDRVRKQEHRP